MWSVLEDEPNTGKTCFIDHLITNHNRNNPIFSFIVWKEFKRYIKNRFRQVEQIQWNRFNWKKEKSDVYIKNY